MQRPTPRCARLANCLIVLARLRTSAVTTALLKSRPTFDAAAYCYKGLRP